MSKKSKDGKSKSNAGGKSAVAFDLADFDIENPVLPETIDEGALTNGGFPYAKRMKREAFDEELRALQIELLKMHSSMQKRGERMVVVFEGRDAAGKGGAIGGMTQHLNPRHATVAALPKPTETERGQWYFQRYAAHLPTSGDITLFDRSWYNRAGVERVMGFCTEPQLARFLEEVPQFEAMLVRDGIRLVKLFLAINRETQLKRFHTRFHDPLKRWKLTEIDLAAIQKWDAYTEAQTAMFAASHSELAPWTVIRANDKLRARIATLRCVLAGASYEGKDERVVGVPDGKIVGSGKGFFDLG